MQALLLGGAILGRQLQLEDLRIAAVGQGKQLVIGQSLLAAGHQQHPLPYGAGGAGQGRRAAVRQLRVLQSRLGCRTAPEQQGRAHQGEDQDQQQVSPVAFEHAHLNV
ncbi:hypothetical protein D3C80_1937060 [compost metagenome]